MSTNEGRPSGGTPGPAKSNARVSGESLAASVVGPLPGAAGGGVPVRGCPDPELQALLTGAVDADLNADDWWKSCARRAVQYLADQGREFTADDVRDLGVPEPDHPGRWGGVFLAASRGGLVECVAARPSAREGRHGSLVRVWRGRPRHARGDAA